MNEQTGKAIERQRQIVNDLHARRGEEVQLARAMREEGIMPAEVRAQQWELINELTERIQIEELALETLERDTRAFMGLLDALTQIADMPDYDPEAGVTVEQLASQYDEARELANAARGAFLLLGVAKQTDERERVCKEIRKELDDESRYMLRHFGTHKYLRVEWRGRATGSRIVMDWADKSESFELAHSDALSIKKAYETVTGDELVEVEEVTNG